MNDAHSVRAVGDADARAPRGDDGMIREISTRIGAVLGSRDNVVWFLGYGTYDGDHIPPAEIGGFNCGVPNPKLMLDTGKVVWGCECWWGSEAAMRLKVEAWEKAGWEVSLVDIDDARREALAARPAGMG
jgi:hypothetical protein